MIVYGLKNCDTCRKALRELAAAGRDAALRDVRAEPLDDATLERFRDAFGDALLNTRSATWRGLPESERARSWKSLLREHPALMKRPVIEDGARLTLGWDADVRSAHLG